MSDVLLALWVLRWTKEMNHLMRRRRRMGMIEMKDHSDRLVH